MFKLVKCSSVGVKSLIQINGSLNKTIIRTKRQTLSRRPLKILTESGKDYYRQNDYKEDISSPKLELKAKGLNERERKEYNKCFDEGFAQDFASDDSNRQKTKRVETKRFTNNTTHSTKPKEFDRNVEQNRNESKESNLKTETVLRPKISGIPVYERLGDKNSEFINIMSSMKTRKRREKLNLMLLEGKRLILDAINANIRIKTIYFTKEENLVGIQNLDLLVSKGMALKKVLYRDVKLFSDVTTSPGILAISERPNNKQIFSNQSYDCQKLPLILIGDNVRDPGNLGTLVRCAAAVGASKLVLTKGCVDAWEAKVLRSGAGAHFRIPIVCDVEWPLIFNHIPVDKPFDLFIAESNNDFERNAISSGQNRSDIPSHTINLITKDFDFETDGTVLRDDSYEDSNPELIKYRNSSIASTSYSDTKFYTLGIDRPTVLVIGGETHGLSDQSYKLAYDYIGRIIQIPLAFGVDSLNSAIAAAVIMYEMKRQFQCKHIANAVESVEQNV